MFTVPLDESWLATMFASVAPMVKFTLEVVGVLVPEYSVRYPSPAPSVAVRLPTTAVALIGMLSTPVTMTFSVFPAPSVVRVLFALGIFSLEQKLGCVDALQRVSASLIGFTGV